MSKFYKTQYNFIKKRFGEKHAETANYGWSSDEKSYMTKIYTNPLAFVCSYKSPATGRTIHEVIQ